MLAMAAMILLLLLLWLPDFWFGGMGAGTFWIPLTGQFVDGNLFSGNLYRGLALCGALLNAGILYVLGVRHAFFKHSLFLLPFFFILFLSAFPQARVFSPAWISAFLVLFSLHKLFLSETEGGNTHIFVAAFLGTLAGLIYMPAWVMLIGLGLGLVVWYRLHIRPYVIFLGGILLPLAGLLLFRFFVYEDADVYLSLLYDAVSHPVGQFPLRTANSLFLLLTFGYLCVRTIWAFLSTDSKLNVFRSRVFSVFVWLLLLCVSALLLYARGIDGFLPILALPVSVCLTFYFSYGRLTGRMKVEFALLLLAIVMNQVQI